MTKGKKKILTAPQKMTLWLLLAVGAALIGALVLLNVDGDNKMPNDKVSPVTTEQQFPIDTSNDGVYTEDKYGVRFNYPEEIFKYQQERFVREGNHVSIRWDKLEDGSSYIGGIEEGADLRFTINGTPINYDKLYSSPVGVINPKGIVSEHATKKVRNLSFEGGTGVVYEVYPEITEAANTIYFRAAWEIGENTYWLTVSTNNKNDTAKYERIFEEIISSFRLIESSR